LIDGYGITLDERASKGVPDDLDGQYIFE